MQKKYIGYLIHHYQNTIFFYSLNFSESVFELASTKDIKWKLI